MKLKLSVKSLAVLSLIVGGLVSQSALANSYDVSCDGYGNCRVSPTMYHHAVVGLAFTKDSEPYFYISDYESVSPDFSMSQIREDTLNACNKSASRSPCTFNRGVANRQCIAVAKASDGYYIGDAGKCGDAKRLAMNTCKSQSDNPSTCKNHKSVSTASWRKLF